MDIKAKLAGLFKDGKFDVDALIALITDIVKAILGYVAGEEGYEYPAE